MVKRKLASELTLPQIRTLCLEYVRQQEPGKSLTTRKITRGIGLLGDKPCIARVGSALRSMMGKPMFADVAKVGHQKGCWKHYPLADRMTDQAIKDRRKAKVKAAIEVESQIRACGEKCKVNYDGTITLDPEFIRGLMD